MNFNVKMSFFTKKETDEITELLESIRVKYDSKIAQNAKFEGIINENDFMLKPTFNHYPRYQLRPEIHGQLSSHESKTQVVLNFKLPKSFKNLLVFALIFNLTIMTIMIVVPNPGNLPFWKFWWLIPVFLIVAYFRLYFSYLFKVKKSAKIISNLLN